MFKLKKASNRACGSNSFGVTVSFVFVLVSSLLTGVAGNSLAQVKAGCDRPIVLLIQPNPYGGQATILLGRRIIIIDSTLNETAPEVVKQFVYYHELAHHLLGHVTAHGAGGGFANPTLSIEDEAAADDFSSRVLIAQGEGDQLSQVAVWILANLHPDPLHPLPSWRAQQLQQNLQQISRRYRDNDPAATAILEVRGTREVHWNKDGCPPKVSLKLVYGNTGAREISCKAIIATGLIPDTVPLGNFSGWSPFDTRDISFTLEPGGETTQQAELTWWRSQGTHPRLIVPDARNIDGSISCHFDKGEISQDNLGALFTRLLAEVPNKFSGIRGLSDVPNDPNDTTYYSTLLLPGQSDTRIRYSSKYQTWIYDARLIDTNDAAVAKQRWSEVKTTLENVLSAGWTATKEPDLKTFSAKSDGGKIMADLYFNDDDKTYIIRLIAISTVK